MNILPGQVYKITLTDLVDLSDIKILIDYEAHIKGLTLICDGHAWHYVKTATNGYSVTDAFINTCSERLTTTLFGGERFVIDYDRIRRDINIVGFLSMRNLLVYEEQLIDFYGRQWPYRLPKQTNPDFIELHAIIKAAQDGLKRHFNRSDYEH